MTEYSDSNQRSTAGSDGGDKDRGGAGDGSRGGDPHSGQRPELSRPDEQSTKADLPGGKGSAEGKAGAEDKSASHPPDKAAAQPSGDKHPGAHDGDRPSLGERATQAMHTKQGDAQSAQIHGGLQSAAKEGGPVGTLAGAADKAMSGGEHFAEKAVQSAVDHTLAGKVDHIANQSFDKTVKETTQELKDAVGALPGGSITVGVTEASEAVGKGNSLGDSARHGLEEGIKHVPFAGAEQHLENASRAAERGDTEKATKEEVLAGGSFAFDVASIVIPAAGELSAAGGAVAEADTAASAEAKSAVGESVPETQRSPGADPPPVSEPPRSTPGEVAPPGETPAAPAGSPREYTETGTQRSPGADPPPVSEPRESVPETQRSPGADPPPVSEPSGQPDSATGGDDVPNSGVRRTEQNESPPSGTGSQKITERPGGDDPDVPQQQPAPATAPEPAESGVREVQPAEDAQAGAGEPREPDPLSVPPGPEVAVPEQPPVPREPDPISLPPGPEVTVPDSTPIPNEPQPSETPSAPELDVPQSEPAVPREPDPLPAPSGPEVTAPEQAPREPDPAPPPPGPDVVGPEDIPREPDPVGAAGGPEITRLPPGPQTAESRWVSEGDGRGAGPAGGHPPDR